MPKLHVGDVELFYQDLGPHDAEPLLMVMGWGGDHTAWAFQLPVFSGQYRVIALDNRGSGQSDAPDVPYSIPGMAADAMGLLDKLGIGRVHVCGASMGGMIAQEIALAHPGRITTLQLHCTFARPDAYGRSLVDTLLKVKARGDREEFSRTMLPWVLSRRTFDDKPDFVQLLLDRGVTYPYPTGLVGLTRQAEAIGAHDTRDRLATIRVPTLVTVGADDILVPPSFSHGIHGRIVGSELVILPDAGHLHFMEQVERFNETVLGFLARHSGR
jgi:pimeloyl-ACP methyl ester carboxylesterase